MAQVGRLLQTLRHAAALTREQAAVSAECLPRRIRELETGRGTLEYLEGLRLAKAYLLCPQCFRRQFEAALDREPIRDPADPSEPTPILLHAGSTPGESSGMP